MSELTFTMLSAYEGDAIELRWADHLAYIDLGRKGTGKKIAAALQAAGKPDIELVVVTHVDFDHIGGALSALVDDASPIADITINDVWFNGYRHLVSEPPPASVAAIESYNVQHGFLLERWLEAGRSWNGAFGGGSVSRIPGVAPEPIDLPDDLRIWVIGPVPDRLEALEPDWKKEILAQTSRPDDDEAPPGWETYGGSRPDLHDRIDLEKLAATPNGDDTISNGSSIALIAEWQGRRLLLAGDAYPEDLLDGVAAVDPGNLHFDVVKLPHHGSKNNVTKPLTDAITADHWAVSTNGSYHNHPDSAAIARILLSNLERAEAAGVAPDVQRLEFNVPSDENRIWDDARWTSRFAYEPRYGSEEDGLSLSFGPKSGT